MPIVVGLTVRRIKEKIYGDTGHLDLVIGDKVLAETEHGQEDAVVCERERMIEKIKDPVAKVIRVLTPDDKKRIADNELKNHEALKIVLGKIEDHELEMKLTCVQYTFDRAKLFIYFVAAHVTEVITADFLENKVVKEFLRLPFDYEILSAELFIYVLLY